MSGAFWKLMYAVNVLGIIFATRWVLTDGRDMNLNIAINVMGAAFSIWFAREKPAYQHKGQPE